MILTDNDTNNDNHNDNDNDDDNNNNTYNNKISHVCTVSVLRNDTKYEHIFAFPKINSLMPRSHTRIYLTIPYGSPNS